MLIYFIINMYNNWKVVIIKRKFKLAEHGDVCETENQRFA